MQATKSQKQLIHINTPNREIKEEFVQWATDDNSKTSASDLSFDQANAILKQLGLKPHTANDWGKFNKNNPKHRVILSLLFQVKWTKTAKGKEVPDIHAFGEWLKSKAPVRRPLLEMTDREVEKTIKALKGVFKSVWK